MTKTPNPAPMMCNSARSTVAWVERPTPLPSRAASRLRLESALALKPAEWGGAPPLLSRRAALAPLRAARYATSHNHQQPTTPRTYHHKTPSRHTTLWSHQSGGTCRLSRSRRRGRGRGRGRSPWRTAAEGAAAAVRGATRSLTAEAATGASKRDRRRRATRSARRVTRPRTGPVPPPARAARRAALTQGRGAPVGERARAPTEEAHPPNRERRGSSARGRRVLVPSSPTAAGPGGRARDGRRAAHRTTDARARRRPRRQPLSS